MTINFTLNGNAVIAEQGQTLLDVANTTFMLLRSPRC